MYQKTIRLLIGLFLIELCFTISSGCTNNNHKTIRIGVLFKSELNGYSNYAQDIENKQNVTIDLNYIVDDTKKVPDLWSVIKKSLASETNNFDLIVGVPSNYIPDLIKEKKVQSMDSYIQRDHLDLNHLYQPVIDISKQIGGGKIYSLAPRFSTSFLMINDSLFKNIKLEVPSKPLSWNDIENIGNSIKQKSENNPRKIYPISLGPGQKIGFFEDYKILSLPLGIKAEGKDGKFYDTKAWKDNLQFFTTIYQKYGLDDASDEEFNRGKVALKVSYLVDLEDRLSKTNWDDTFQNFKMSILPMPYYKNLPQTTYTRVDDNMLIPENSIHKKQAWGIVKYTISRDYADNHININTGSIPFKGDFFTYYDKSTINLYKKRYNDINADYFYYGKKGRVDRDTFNYQTYEKLEAQSLKYFYQMLDRQNTVTTSIKLLNDSLKK
ncbi:hypothetical protein EWI07_07045 [Sporolactobacillus sp. THM7-4]|nr:hypothetical protein EWI07_07045 [Sporolactobacillus sp. THM7-4]